MVDPRQSLKTMVTDQMMAWLSESSNDVLEFNEVFRKIWINCRAAGGLRLTDLGYDLMLSHDVVEYRFDLASKGEFSNRSLFVLDKKMKTPYYILMKGARVSTRKIDLVPASISLFGSEESLLLSLHSDINRFLELL